MPPEFEGNGWTQYQKLVLAELERHSDMLEKMNSDFNTFRITFEKARARDRALISALQVKAGVWGAIAGVIPVAIMIFLEATKH